MRPLFFSLLFCAYNIVLAQQCPGRVSSKGDYEFDIKTKLFAPPKIAYNIVGNIGMKFFFEKKDYPRLLGYENNFDLHPNAFAICKESTENYEKSKKIVGKTRTGYVWLENKWMLDSWKKEKFKLNPELMFLIGHEIIHILHRKDVNFQRLLVKIEEGKFAFKRDKNGDYVGFFSDIPDKLKDHAEELHADYGGGLVLYDLVLYNHDNWIMRTDDEDIRNAHQKKYDSIIAGVEKFIQHELAPEVSTSHGSAEERVKYFRMGVADRKKLINSKGDAKLQRAIMSGSDSELINSLTEAGKILRKEYSVIKRGQ